MHLYTIKEVADILGVGEDAVWGWVRRGWLPAVKLPNGRIRITKEALDKALTPVEPDIEVR